MRSATDNSDDDYDNGKDDNDIQEMTNHCS